MWLAAEKTKHAELPGAEREVKRLFRGRPTKADETLAERWQVAWFVVRRMDCSFR